MIVRHPVIARLVPLAITLASIAACNASFSTLSSRFEDVAHGWWIAACIAIALRISFFVFADLGFKANLTKERRFLLFFGCLCVSFISLLRTDVPSWWMSPIDHAILDILIIALVAARNMPGSRSSRA